MFISVKATTKLNPGHTDKSEIKIKKLAVGVHILPTTQNSVISRCFFADDDKKCTKNYDARAQPLYCSLNLLFSGVAAAVAVKPPTITLKGLKGSLITKLRKKN